MSYFPLNRRHLFAFGVAALHTGVQAQPERLGRLVIVGGAEDRLDDKIILRRFMALSGGERANILILTVASADQTASWKGYESVFSDMGATGVTHLAIHSTDEANDPVAIDRILSADGIFMTGGDQRRLMERLLDTGVARAMHTAFHLRRCCIGGTSAGAAALSRVMLAEGDTPSRPLKDAAMIGLGLGFVSGAVIDQHFSQRRRLGRLMSVLAQRPDMLGVGIDEDTALVIERGTAIEVIGQGVVTLIDGRRMQSNFDAVAASEHLEMLGVTMHVLPAGNRYVANPGSGTSRLPATLQDAIAALVAPGPIRG